MPYVETISVDVYLVTYDLKKKNKNKNKKQIKIFKIHESHAV